MALVDRLREQTGEQKTSSLISKLRAEKGPEVSSPLLETPAPPSPQLTGEQLKTMELEGLPITTPAATPSPFVTEPVTGPAAVPVDIAEAILHLGKGAMALPAVGAEMVARGTGSLLGGADIDEALATAQEAGGWLGPGPQTVAAEVVGKIAEIPRRISEMMVSEVPPGPPSSVMAGWARAHAREIRKAKRLAGVKPEEPFIPRDVMSEVSIAAKTIFGTAIELGLYALIGRAIHRTVKGKARPNVVDIEKAATQVETRLRKGGYTVGERQLRPEARTLADEIMKEMGIEKPKGPEVIYKKRTESIVEPEVTGEVPVVVPEYIVPTKLYEGMNPGTHEWLKLWRDRPEMQGEMAEYARGLRKESFQPDEVEVTKPVEPPPVQETRDAAANVIETDPTTYKPLASGKPRPVPVDDSISQYSRWILELKEAAKKPFREDIPIVREGEGMIPAEEQILVQQLREFKRKSLKELTPEERAEAMAAGEKARAEFIDYSEAVSLVSKGATRQSRNILVEAIRRDPDSVTNLQEKVRSAEGDTVTLWRATRGKPLKDIESFTYNADVAKELGADISIDVPVESVVAHSKYQPKIMRRSSFEAEVLVDTRRIIPEAEKKIGETRVEAIKPEKDVVTMDDVHTEAEKIMSEAKDLNDLHEKMQDLTTRYENNLDKGFIDAFEENRYVEWGDEVMTKINQARRQKGLIEEPPAETLDFLGMQKFYERLTESGKKLGDDITRKYNKVDPDAKVEWAGNSVFITRKGKLMESPTKEPHWMTDEEFFGRGNTGRTGEVTGFIEANDRGPGKELYLRVYRAISPEQMETIRNLSNNRSEITITLIKNRLESAKGYDKESLPQFFTDASPRPETLGFGGTGEFQKMYEAFVDRFKKRSAETGHKVGPEVREILDKGKIVSQRRVKGRYRPPIYEAELEVLKECNKLPETFLRRGFENPIRTFEEAGGEAFLDMTTHRYHAREAGVIKLQKALKESRDELFKGVSTKMRRRVGTYAIAQQKNGTAKLLKKGVKEADIPTKLTPKEQALYDALRDRFETWYRRLSNLRESVGKEPFPKTEDYFTFIRNFTMLENAGFRPLDMPSEVLDAQFTKMGATPFKFAKPRTKAIYSIEVDPLRILELYENSAARHVQMTPFIAKMRELQSGIKDPETGKRFRLVNENPVLARSLHSWTNHIAGMKSPTFQLPPAVENIMMRVNGNLAASILGANVRSAMIQVSALRNTVAEIGYYHTTRGILSLVDPRARNFAMKKSKVLSQRTYDVTVEDALRKIKGGKIFAAKRLSAKLAMKPLQILDMETAKATWQGAYDYGRSKLHLNERRAINYADDVVTRTQASAMPGDIAPVQRSVVGKFFTLFQTFTINDWDFLVKDVVGVRKGGPLTKRSLAKALRYITATTLFNSLFEDVLHIQTPFPNPIRAFKESLDNGDDIPSLLWNTGSELIEPIPIIGAARYGKGPGGPGAELLSESVKFVRQDPMARPWWELSGKWLGAPGTAQVGKAIRAKKRGETPYGQVVGTYTKPTKPIKTMQSLRQREGIRSLE